MALPQPDPVAMNRVQELLAEQFPDPAPDVVVNREAVLALGQPEVFRYRGRTWRVPPISYRDGLQLQRATQALETIKNDPASTPDQMEVWMDETVALYGDLIRHRWLRWLPNPFRHAREAEVGQLLAVFTRCRMIGDVVA